MDWLPKDENREEYAAFLADIVVSEMPCILGTGFDPDTPYKASLMTLHKAMLSELDKHGRRELIQP